MQSHRSRNLNLNQPDGNAGIKLNKEFVMATTTVETTKLIDYRNEAGVAVITMTDPPANTYTYEMNRQLDEAILKARMDNDVYVIVLTGAGDKFFSAVESGFGFCDVVFGWDLHDHCYDNTKLTGWQHGFPDAIARLDLNTYRTVREYEAAGAAGINLEDQVYPKRCGHLAGKQVIPPVSPFYQSWSELRPRHRGEPYRARASSGSAGQALRYPCLQVRRTVPVRPA